MADPSDLSGGARLTAERVLSRQEKNRLALIRSKQAQNIAISAADEELLLKAQRRNQTTDEANRNSI